MHIAAQKSCSSRLFELFWGVIFFCLGTSPHVSQCVSMHTTAFSRVYRHMLFQAKKQNEKTNNTPLTFLSRKGHLCDQKRRKLDNVYEQFSEENV